MKVDKWRPTKLNSVLNMSNIAHYKVAISSCFHNINPVLHTLNFCIMLVAVVPLHQRQDTKGRNLIMFNDMLESLTRVQGWNKSQGSAFSWTAFFHSSCISFIRPLTLARSSFLCSMLSSWFSIVKSQTEKTPSACPMHFWTSANINTSYIVQNSLQKCTGSNNPEREK